MRPPTRHPRPPFLHRLAVLVASMILSTTAFGDWTVVYLHPAGATESWIYGADGGLQVGAATVGSIERACLWSGTAASWVDLHPQAATRSTGYGGGGGQQAGVVVDAGVHRASYWVGSSGSRVDLRPAGAANSYAYGAGGGQQVGFANVGNAHRASLWSGSASSWVDLTPPGLSYSDAFDADGFQQVGSANVSFSPHASLWTGSGASWVDLHPGGSFFRSGARAVHAGQQVGAATHTSNADHAGLWSGTAASFVDLSPAGSASSVAYDIAGGEQVGTAKFGDVQHAGIWRGSAASFVDLHAKLPANYLSSEARGIARVGGFTYVVGFGFNSSNLRNEALMWVRADAAALGVRSANPASGVPISVWVPDKNGMKNGITAFDRTYDAGTVASLTAPLNLGNQWFDHWEKDGIVVPGGARTLSVTMAANHLVKAVFMPGRTLTVTSVNPASGVPITVWTADKNGLKNGVTGFSRTYTQGSSATLTAPAIIGTQYFKRWDLDGLPWQATKTVNVPMGANNRTVSAVYGSGVELAVESAEPSVPITVWKTDLAGRRDGSTNFSRLYSLGVEASLTAPAQVSGKPFVRWEKDGVPVPGNSRTVKVMMDAEHAMVVVYGP